jgi:hypothetical protein
LSKQKEFQGNKERKGKTEAKNFVGKKNQKFFNS